MENPSKNIQSFWERFLASLPAGKVPPAAYDYWHFCDNEKDADELGELVLRGIKTATCAQLQEYEHEGEKITAPGDYSIITNWRGEPLCVIQVTSVRIVPYCEVDAHHAGAEGEGDRSLDYWRKVHYDCFSRECDRQGWNFSEDTPLVLLEFKVGYR